MWYVPNISAANKNMMINVSAKVLEEHRERERERERESFGGGREGDLVRKCGCHRKTQSLPQKISGFGR
jgi:hypothetical protein